LAANFRNRISMQPMRSCIMVWRGHPFFFFLSCGWTVEVAFFSSCVWCGVWTAYCSLSTWTVDFPWKCFFLKKNWREGWGCQSKEFPRSWHIGVPKERNSVFQNRTFIVFFFGSDGPIKFSHSEIIIIVIIIIIINN
jgi:hypothetical protein